MCKNGQIISNLLFCPAGQWILKTIIYIFKNTLRGICDSQPHFYNCSCYFFHYYYLFYFFYWNYKEEKENQELFFGMHVWLEANPFPDTKRATAESLWPTAVKPKQFSNTTFTSVVVLSSVHPNSAHGHRVPVDSTSISPEFIYIFIYAALYIKQIILKCLSA